MTDTITNTWLNMPTEDQQGGLMLSFGDQSTYAPKTDITWTKPTLDNPRPEAAAKLVGHFGDLTQGPKITADSITIKAQNSFDLGLPKFFGFAFPAAVVMANDLLNLYGEDRFYSAQINFIGHRTDVEPESAQRNFAGFDDWHTHVAQKDVDYIYSLCGALPTEFKLETGEIYQPPSNSLTRFGVETEHRSPTNTSNETLRRLWGAFAVRPEGTIFIRGKKYPNNPGLVRPDHDLYEDFLQAGENYLKNHSNLESEMASELA